MLIFFSIFIIQGIRIQNGCKMKHFLDDILSQQIRQIQAYHGKLIVISMLPFTAEKNFCHTKLQTIIIKVVFSKFLYLIANWTHYPKPIKEALTILKFSIKITHYQLL